MAGSSKARIEAAGSGLGIPVLHTGSSGSAITVKDMNLPLRNSPAMILESTRRAARFCGATFFCLSLMYSPAQAVTTVLFNASQTISLVATNMNSDTYASEGYRLTLSRDKLFTGGYGLTNPIGRFTPINWPTGLTAQAITTGPNTGGARMDLTRTDGQPFSIPYFVFRILANTAGAGAMLEVMPLIKGEDALPDPLMYQATGFYGQTFSNSTPELANYDAYKITLYVDFALLNLKLVDPSLPPPVLSMYSTNGTPGLTWSPDTETNWILQETFLLEPGTWSNAPTGSLHPINLPADSPAKFYRLIRN